MTATAPPQLDPTLTRFEQEVWIDLPCPHCSEPEDFLIRLGRPSQRWPENPGTESVVVHGCSNCRECAAEWDLSEVVERAEAYWWAEGPEWDEV